MWRGAFSEGNMLNEEVPIVMRVCVTGFVQV